MSRSCGRWMHRCRSDGIAMHRAGWVIIGLHRSCVGNADAVVPNICLLVTVQKQRPEMGSNDEGRRSENGQPPSASLFAP